MYRTATSSLFDEYPDPRAVLEAALGPLALFEVLTEPEPAAEVVECW